MRKSAGENQQQMANPRTAVMAEKRAQIISAAQDAFLRNGYVEASMDDMAAAAGVSVKTIYSHFGNKGELFTAVMKATCVNPRLRQNPHQKDALSAIYPWIGEASEQGLRKAGQAYLEHLLSGDQLALYRVVTRDADRFPELGQLYQTNIAQGRTEILVEFLARTVKVLRWNSKDLTRDAKLFEALLRADIFEQVLHGLQKPNSEVIEAHARSAAKTMWSLLKSGRGR